MTLRAQLETARLTLRPVAASDEAAVVACLNDLDVSGWLAVVPYPYTSADFQSFQGEYAIAGMTYAVEDSDGLAGIVGVEDRTLGYWFAPSRHGRGYATEAARAALAAHFVDNPADIASGYFVGNARSANVLRKLGFVETGRDLKHCHALGVDRAHVQLRLTPGAFRAALPIEARSARLNYRSLQAIDAPSLHAIVSHWDVTRQLGPKWPWPAEMAFTVTRAKPHAGAGFAWGIFLGCSLIGTVSVTQGELGYMLAPEAWGKGYGFEACQCALSQVFSVLGKDFVTAGVWADNAASLRLLAKLGFRTTADDRSWSRARQAEAPGHLLRLDRADWQARLTSPPG